MPTGALQYGLYYKEKLGKSKRAYLQQIRAFAFAVLHKNQSLGMNLACTAETALSASSSATKTEILISEVEII